jgi:hypothetical protein
LGRERQFTVYERSRSPLHDGRRLTASWGRERRMLRDSAVAMQRRHADHGGVKRLHESRLVHVEQKALTAFERDVARIVVLRDPGTEPRIIFS